MTASFLHGLYFLLPGWQLQLGVRCVLRGSYSAGGDAPLLAGGHSHGPHPTTGSSSGCYPSSTLAFLRPFCVDPMTVHPASSPTPTQGPLPHALPPRSHTPCSPPPRSQAPEPHPPQEASCRHMMFVRPLRPMESFFLFVCFHSEHAVPCLPERLPEPPRP